MKIIAALFGMIAGLAGVVGGFSQVFIGAVGEAVNAEGATAVAEAGAGAFWLSFLIILAGALAFGKPKHAGIGMIVLGIITAVLGHLFSGPAAVVAGIIAFTASKEAGAENG